MSRKAPGHFALAIVFIALISSTLAAQRALTAFTVEQVKSYPFPDELTAARSGSRIAWALDERGLRNIWVAEAPAFTARRLTNYTADDGQELTSVSISNDGKYVVYVRGGDHSSNWDDGLPVNPTGSPSGYKVQVWSVPFGGGEPKALAEGDEPAISPRADRVAFTKNHEIWISPTKRAKLERKGCTSLHFRFQIAKFRHQRQSWLKFWGELLTRCRTARMCSYTAARESGGAD